MKNWGKCLHESQTNIWDVCMCVRVCAYVDDGGRRAKGGKAVLPCLAQVQWSLPILNNLPRPWPWTLKNHKKFINWWNHEESI